MHEAAEKSCYFLTVWLIPVVCYYQAVLRNNNNLILFMFMLKIMTASIPNAAQSL